MLSVAYLKSVAVRIHIGKNDSHAYNAAFVGNGFKFGANVKGNKQFPCPTVCRSPGFILERVRLFLLKFCARSGVFDVTVRRRDRYLRGVLVLIARAYYSSSLIVVIGLILTQLVFLFGVSWFCSYAPEKKDYFLSVYTGAGVPLTQFIVVTSMLVFSKLNLKKALSSK